jgi:hypothetical protein
MDYHIGLTYQELGVFQLIFRNRICDRGSVGSTSVGHTTTFAPTAQNIHFSDCLSEITNQLISFYIATNNPIPVFQKFLQLLSLLWVSLPSASASAIIL